MIIGSLGLGSNPCMHVQLEMMYYADRKWLGLIDVLSVVEQKSLGIEELEKLYVLKTKH